MRRAEKELQERGGYSWTAGIRSRVRIARSVCRSEAEFRSLLGTLGVIVSDNSPKAPRRDWIYAFADRPSRRVSGERLEPMLRTEGMGRLDDSSERTIADIARRAVKVENLEELDLLSKTVELIYAAQATSLDDLEAFVGEESLPEGNEASSLANYARIAHLLPARHADIQPKNPASESRRAHRQRLAKGRRIAYETIGHENAPHRQSPRIKGNERAR